MADTQVAAPSAVPETIDGNGMAHMKDLKLERPAATVVEGQRDSGIDMSHDEATHDPAGHERPPTSASNIPEEVPHVTTDVTTDVQEEHREEPQPRISSQEVAPSTEDDDTEAGPSNNPPPRDNAALRPMPHRGESTINAVGYRRNTETVIAFLVPLPKPTIQGSTLDVPAKYFLYTPPPPHLLKPKKGGKESYGTKANRVWQRNVRKAKTNAHNGKRVSLSAVHSAAVRGCIWASERRKGDDDGAVFLARIQPKTVAHLVMIHPWALSADQAPEDILKTFRGQITASKASSFVKILTKKMGPEPKTLQISPSSIIEGTHGPRGSESSEEEEAVVGVVETEQPRPSRKDRMRASFESAKQRNPVTAIKSQINQRGRKRHREGSPSASAQDTAEHAEPGSTEFTGGELEHYSEEEAPADPGLVDAEGEPFSGHQLGEIPEEGDHFEDAPEQPATATAGPSSAPQTAGGVLAGSTQDAANDAELDSKDPAEAKKGSRFQLTFYPSPAMDIMSRYIQQSCHAANGHAFPSPSAAPTAAGVLASIGWEPERRGYTDAEEQLEDENWQAREIEEDLAAATEKAARAWEKQCRKHVRQSKSGRLSGDKKPGQFAILVARVRPRKQAKGKAREEQPEQPSEKKGNALKQRLAAIKNKRSKKQTEEPEEGPSEKKDSALKQRLAAIKAKRSKKQIAEPETSAEGPTEKKAKTAALRQRLAAMKEKRNKKQTEQTEETDPAAKQTKKEKLQKAAGIIFFPVILILGTPVLIGKGISSGYKKVRDRKKKTDGDAEGSTEQPQQQEKKAGRRAAVKQRLSERSGSVKRGLSTRSDAMKKRRPERKAKKAPADGAAASATAPDSSADAAGPTDAGDTSAETKLTKKQRLTALVLAGPLAINEILKKRRQGQDKSTTTHDATPKEKKASKFSATKERVKGLRTKVNKEARFAKLKNRLRVIKERRKSKKNIKNNNTSTDDSVTATDADDSNDKKNVKKQGAIAGLVAGCVALPAAKVKQARDKRRKGRAADSVQGAAVAAREEHATASSSSVAAAGVVAAASAERESASSLSQPRSVRVVPSEPERLEPAGEQFSPPQNGQSEVPIQQAVQTEPHVGPATRDGDVSAAAVAAPGAGEAQAESPAAAVRFRSIRDGFGNVKGGIGSGITNLKARRRGTGQTEGPIAEEAERPPAETMDSAETHVEANPTTVEPTTQPTAQQDPAAPGGRFKSIKGGIGSGIDGLKARTQREKKATPPQSEGPATMATAEEEKRAAAAANKDGAFGARLQALKDGIGNRKTKEGENGATAPFKTEKHKQQKPQAHKVGNPGIGDRMRWFLYAA
ncbi:hypothetical protein Daus18300_013346 [Diaporthe australafricana]|uniref:Uncharacterized protein n=1 Tax=Diaporthe australafricana TaxID=127596 RepID=A0ABR3VZK6_9PEZI